MAQLAMSIKMESWKNTTGEKTLHVLVCGLGGVGKSALINHLFPLKDYEKPAQEGRIGGATKPVVSKYKRSSENGDKINFFDTPGFDSTRQSNEEIIAMIENATKGQIDVVLYCISLDGSARVQHGDIATVSVLTRAFTREIWKKTVVALTFANALEQKFEDPEVYKSVVQRVTEDIRQVFSEHAQVDAEIISQLPVVTAGYDSPILKHEQKESTKGWNSRLYEKAIKQAKTTPLQIRIGWSDLKSIVLNRGVFGFAVFGLGVGFMLGLLLSQLGGYSPLSFFVWTVIGGGIGAARGAGFANVASELYTMTTITKVVLKKWQLTLRNIYRQTVLDA